MSNILLILFHLLVFYDIVNLYSDIQCFSYPSVVVHDSQFWLFIMLSLPSSGRRIFLSWGKSIPTTSFYYRSGSTLPRLYGTGSPQAMGIPSSSGPFLWSFQWPFLLTHEEGLSKNEDNLGESRIGRWAKTDSQWLIWASAWNQWTPFVWTYEFLVWLN